MRVESPAVMHRTTAQAGAWFSRAAVWAAVVVVQAYQVMLRPLLIGTCKYCPSCSDYAVEALRTHGLWRGGWLAVRRVLRCHPFSPGGIDPVPQRERPQAPSGSGE